MLTGLVVLPRATKRAAPDTAGEEGGAPKRQEKAFPTYTEVKAQARATPPWATARSTRLKRPTATGGP